MADLRKWEPFRELATVQKDMDEFFRRMLGGLTTGIFRREMTGEWYPAIDCYMKENHLVVRADLPGVDPADVDISVTGNTLTIKGERKSETEKKNEGYLYHEATFGSFERTITLPEGVDTARIHASCKNGIIEVTMPAKAEALPRKVKVEIGEGNKKAA